MYALLFRLEMFKRQIAKIRGSISRIASSAVKKSRYLGKSDSIPELEHLNFSLLGALGQSIVNREINEKIQQGYFADRLVFVPALPKSASSVIGECISVIQGNTESEARRYSSVRAGTGNGMLAHGKYMIPNWDPNLRPEVVIDFPQGGVLKYHMHPNSSNLKVLDLLGTKYVVVCRHPADQLVALYCHYSGRNDRESWISEGNILYDPVYPLDGSVFELEGRPEEGLRYMIEEGYLAAVLKWASTWLKVRSQERSLVVRYEDFFTDQPETLRGIARFLGISEISSSTIEKCGEVADVSAFTRKTDINQEKYRKGWSGKIGVWRDYLSKSQVELYRNTITNFLQVDPNGRLLLDLYPDLLDLNLLVEPTKGQLVNSK